VETANKRIASHTHYPLSGPYDSNDPKVIERHLRQTKAAGIDTLVCSWWGRQDPTDKAIRLLLEKAPTEGLTVCVYWERLLPRPDKLAASADLAYLLQTFGSKPGYLKLEKRPVLFLTQSLC
jgi:glycoprotein endo-alpha-1,2-mannosidase